MKTYEEYLQEAGNVHLAYYLEAAGELGINYKILVPSLLAEFRNGNKFWHIINTATPLTTTTGATICKRKQLTNLILRTHNIPVPIQINLNTEEEAIDFFNKYKDIVIKPIRQLGGKGVSILPQTEEDVKKDFQIAYEDSKIEGNCKVIGEQFIEGENYRFLVLGDKVIGIVRRKSANIIGDGLHSIKELIDIKNKEKKELILKPIIIDNEVFTKLKRENLTLDSIPQKDKEVILRYNCNLTTGGYTEECSKEVNDYYIQIAIKSVRAVGCKLGGVDMIAKNITKPDTVIVNEINYNPGLRLHYKVDKGEVVKVAIPIMEYIKTHI